MALAPIGRGSLKDGDIFPLPDSLNSFVDLSGTTTPIHTPADPFAQKSDEDFDNPYDMMIHNCNNDPVYLKHTSQKNSL